MLPQDLRLRQLEQAGAMRIPFTTGILCGIGESRDDRGTWRSATSSWYQCPTIGSASFSVPVDEAACSPSDGPVSSLEVIARVAEEYGHIQECIIQPHRRGPRQRRQGSDQSFDLHKDLPQVRGAQGSDYHQWLIHSQATVFPFGLAFR